MINLTAPQKNVVETDQFFKNTSISNIGGYSLFFTKVNLEIMAKGINKLIQNADGLRLRLKKEDNNETKQFIVDFKPEEIEVISMDVENALEKSNEWMREPFDLYGKLYEFKLLDFGEKQGIFIKLHHAISDAWSMAIVYSKVLKYYEELLKQGEIVDDIPSYKVFLKVEEEYINSDTYKKDEEYWKNKYEEKPTYVSLANKKGVIDAKANRKSFVISKEERKKIEEYCTSSNISMAVFFEAIVSLYSARVNNADDITLCTLGINRSGRIERKIVGMFNNILPMTVKLDWNAEFLDLCRSITKVHYEIFRHQKYPYKEIMNLISERHGSSNIYDIMVSYQNASFYEDLDVKYRTHWNFNGYAELSFMMNIDDLQNTGELNINIDYKLEAFTESEIEKIYNRLIYIINQIILNNEIKFKDIEIVTKEEKIELLEKFNNTKVDYPKEKRIYDYLEEWALNEPQKVALYYENKEMTYGEFNEKVNALANYIINRGVKKNSVIAVMAERSFEMMIAIYAILKAGFAYMPIDPKFPIDRIEFMLEDSEAPFVIIQSKWKEKLSQKQNYIEVDKFEFQNYSKDNPKIDVSSKDIAYVIYTSGSTGKPKGAKIQHHSVINRIKWMHEKYPLNKEDVILQKTPYTFDVSVWELFWWSMYGGALKLLVPDGHKDPLEIINAIYNSDVTHIHFVPSMLNAFLQYLDSNKNLIEKLRTLKYVFASGEALQSEHVKKLYELLGENKTTIHNLYGPTECTVDVSYYDCLKESIPESIPIGRPVDNTQLLILDKLGNLLPIGAAGELCISGVLVGKGYIKREELTKEKFIENRYYNFDKIYKTGDLARWLEDGNIEYLGRIDNQIKIRGLRVELGDIENAILKFPSIAEVVVTVFENLGEKYLCAYYVATEPINIKLLNDDLIKELPDYMIPSYYVQLEKMPLNHNGKIDRKALPKPNTNIEEKYVEPENEVEEKLQEIISKVLNKEKISVESDLMTAGLTSLGVITVITQLSMQGIEIRVQDFYKCKTIRNIAEIISVKNSKTEGYEEDEEYKDISDIEKIFVETKEDGDILLTGVTGFLGIHLLEELYHNTSKNIYCIIRNKDKFYEFLKLYTTIPKDSDRVIILNGDITKEFLGLGKVYDKLKENVNLIIHSAASVSYFCSWEKAKNINYIGTCNIIKFAEQSKARLHHISTMSVSGDILTEQTVPYPKFCEKNLYIGQLYKDNVYAYSKYLAEKEIIKAIRDEKIAASIYRLPNLTWRIKDGIFQKNYSENDLYIMTKVMYRLKKVPLEIKDENFLVTPVDDLAKAILSLILNVKKNSIFHLVSTESPTIEDYMKLLVDVKAIPIKELYREINEVQNDSEMQFVSMYLNGILKDAKKMVVNIDSKKTAEELEKLNFKWGKIDKRYVEFFNKIDK